MLVRIIELLGIAAFSASGAAVGIKRRMDLFGVVILGLCTSFGGGILRDLMLGITPPSIFYNPVYALTALAVALIVFIPRVRRALVKNPKLYDAILTITDALGIGIFTVVGIRTAYCTCAEPTFSLLVFVGTISAVGGGVLRDVFAGHLPQIFVRNFYALAAMTGSIVCICLWQPLGELPAMVLGAVVTVASRLLGWHFHWRLPNAVSDTEVGV